MSSTVSSGFEDYLIITSLKYSSYYRENFLRYHVFVLLQVSREIEDGRVKWKKRSEGVTIKKGKHPSTLLDSTVLYNDESQRSEIREFCQYAYP